MSEVFLKLVNMSITASVMILFVVLLRLLFQRFPRKYICILWMLVGLRLICPVTLESAMSLIPSAEPIPGEVLESRTMWVETGIDAFDRPVNDYFEDYYEGVSVPVNYKEQILNVLTWVWLAGVGGMLVYAGGSFFILRRRLKTAVHLRENLWQSEHVKSPFILGMLRPRIYLPFSLKEPQLTYVLAHERAHIGRGDHYVKPVGFLLLSVYWFNPFIWLAFCLLCRDLEQACDERVIYHMDETERKEYAKSLFHLSVKSHGVGACPVAFGEVGVKERIKSVLRYHKPALWVGVLAVLGCVVAGVCFLTNPRESVAAGTNPVDGTDNPDGNAHFEGLEGTYPIDDNNVGIISDGSYQWFDGSGGQEGQDQENLPQDRMEGSKEGGFENADEEALPNNAYQWIPAGGEEELTLEMIAAMGENNDFLQYDFNSFINGVRDDHSDMSADYTITFSYMLEGDEILLTVSALKEDDSLESIHLWRDSNGDAMRIYSVGNEYRDEFLLSEEIARNTADRDVQSFLDHAYTIKDDISYELPEGLTESKYRASIGFAGGILLLPNAYEVYGDEDSWAPPQWMAAGMISRFYTEDLVVWNGNVIQEIYPFFNHTGEEALGSVDGLDAPGFLQKCNHDLYTVSELDNLAEQGIHVPEEETTSDYWYVYMAKPGEPIGFVISLNAKNYTSEDAIAFAKSVKWK